MYIYIYSIVEVNVGNLDIYSFISESVSYGRQLEDFAVCAQKRWEKADLEKNLFLDGFVAFGGGRYQCPGR